MSRRIVGFGNFQPPEDTVLPDGSINVGRDVTLGDLTQSAVGAVQNGVGAFLGGFKEFLTGPLASNEDDPEGLHAGIESDLSIAQPGLAGSMEGQLAGSEGIRQDEEESDDEESKHWGYQCSVGEYLPPMVPMPTSVATFSPAVQEGRSAPASLDLLTDDVEESRADEESRAALLRLLGIAGAGSNEPAAVQQQQQQQQQHQQQCPVSIHPGEHCEPSEADILDILGIRPASDSANQDLLGFGVSDTQGPGSLPLRPRVEQAVELQVAPQPVGWQPHPHHRHQLPGVGGLAHPAGPQQPVQLTSPPGVPCFMGIPLPRAQAVCTTQRSHLQTTRAVALNGGPGFLGPGMIEV